MGVCLAERYGRVFILGYGAILVLRLFLFGQLKPAEGIKLA